MFGGRTLVAANLTTFLDEDQPQDHTVCGMYRTDSGTRVALSCNEAAHPTRASRPLTPTTPVRPCCGPSPGPVALLDLRVLDAYP